MHVDDIPDDQRRAKLIELMEENAKLKTEVESLKKDVERKDDLLVQYRLRRR